MRVFLEIGSKHGQTKRVALTADAVIGRGSSSNLRIGSRAQVANDMATPY